MKAPKNVTTPAQYLASVPPGRRAAMQALHDSIRKAAPALTPVIVHGMLGFGPYHYKYASGHEGDSATVCLASQKNHISLYLMAGADGDLVEKNKARLGKVSVGKCCIRFTKLEHLDMKVAMDLVKQAAKFAEKSGRLPS